MKVLWESKETNHGNTSIFLSFKSFYSPFLHHQPLPPSFPVPMLGPGHKQLIIKWPAHHLSQILVPRRYSRENPQANQRLPIRWDFRASSPNFISLPNFTFKQTHSSPASWCWKLVRQPAIGPLKQQEVQVQTSFVRGPQDHLGFNDSLERLTELRKAVLLIVVDYYSERIQIKINKGKKHTEQNPGEARCKLPVILSQWIHVDSA